MSTGTARRFASKARWASSRAAGWRHHGWAGAHCGPGRWDRRCSARPPPQAGWESDGSQRGLVRDRSCVHLWRRGADQPPHSMPALMAKTIRAHNANISAGARASRGTTPRSAALFMPRTSCWPTCRCMWSPSVSDIRTRLSRSGSRPMSFVSTRPELRTCLRRRSSPARTPPQMVSVTALRTRAQRSW